MGVAEVSSLGSEESPNGNFNGRVVFHNIFKGNLPAAEHPKLLFYGVMTLVYLALGLAWLSLCTIHREQIVTVQYFISAMIAFLFVEMACEWLFYAYYNNHEIDFLRFNSVDKNAAVTGMARFLLVLTSILGAARDSLSFFLLLIVSMGYGVVRPTIGSVIRKVQLLTGLHFIFGVLYSVGIILILLEMGGSWTLLFIFPLAGTLSAFMSWILYSLKSTMQYLSDRRQTYKFTMFQRLYLILMCAVVAIIGFFFFSSFLLATSDTSDLATTAWEYRWFVLDGSLTLLYFIGQNMRLAMSDELATDEEADAGQYEREEELPRYSKNGPYKEVQKDDLVFDADDQEPIPPTRTSYDASGNDTERERLQLSDDEDDYAQKSR
ncbi:hypothetical protein MBRA1_000610 [Malassezia brasiliensis]|uniref:GOST seven transmembrane domain-containing protein n=1 Tax=Malassezia brasiliensis TaxID=1821822 RepID=A0AAF0DRA2_9BASI|nr:hypothetical protein MBRA1_000610 [Malassezia brasiliensis]